MAMKVFLVGDVVRVQLDANPDFDIPQGRCAMREINGTISIFDNLFLIYQTDELANVQDQGGTPTGTMYETIQYLSKFIFIMDSKTEFPDTTDLDLAHKSVSASLSRALQTTIGLINNTATFETYLSLSVTPTKTENYSFKGSYPWSVDSVNQNFVERVLLVEGASTIRTVTPFRVEVPDAGGVGELLDTLSGGIIGAQSNTGTDQKHRTEFAFEEILTAGLTYTITIEWAGGGPNLEAAIYEALLSCTQAKQTPAKL